MKSLLQQMNVATYLDSFSLCQYFLSEMVQQWLHMISAFKLICLFLLQVTLRACYERHVSFIQAPDKTEPFRPPHADV